MSATASPKSIIIAGATGMVGGEALQLALDHPGVDAVTAVVRRPLGITHPKLREVVHSDFTDWSGAEAALRGHDAALYCIGVYTGSVPEKEFRNILVEYSGAFAKALHQQSPEAALCFLSGAGADQSGRSRTNFARFLGEAESSLLHSGLPRVALFRPGYIYPVKPRKEPNLMYRILRPLYPIAKLIYPNIGIASSDLAKAMLHVALDSDAWTGGPVLENRDIRSVAHSLPTL